MLVELSCWLFILYELKMMPSYITQWEREYKLRRYVFGELEKEKHNPNYKVNFDE
jgi:hypothetical protein